MASRPVLERMTEVLSMHRWSRREWARRAGLAEESHVGTLMRRMEDDPEGRLAGDIETYTRLAAAAHVSLDWLLLGRGTPHGLIVEVAEDPRYPSRARVLAVAHWGGISEAAIRATLAHNEPETDPGAAFWMQFLALKALELGQGTKQAR